LDTGPLGLGTIKPFFLLIAPNLIFKLAYFCNNRGKETILRAFCYQALYLLFRLQKCGFTTPSQDAGIQVYSSFSGCRNAGLQLLWMQE
jgi:hypothetical protein